MGRPNSVALNESLVFARDASYLYRTGKGMIPSAEWVTFMEDFHGLITSNAPSGWSTIIDTGATLTTFTTTATNGGVVQITSDAASEGVAIYRPRTVVLSGKRFFMEARFRTSNATDSTVKFGLSDLTATTNPEDLWTTTAASFIAVGIDDGAATPTLVYDDNNTGPVTQTSTSTTAIVVADTWHTVAFDYNGSTATGGGVGALNVYFDGGLVLTSSTAQLPITRVLSPYIGHLAGNGAVRTCDIDYVRYSIQR
jgi:hypothetical protein